jgi:hypothetical protein
MTDFRALCAELLQELCCHYRSWELKEGYCSDAMTRAQAALLAQPKPQGPVPVTERLPRPQDCDAEGKCWWWVVDEPGAFPHWICAPLEAQTWAGYSAWLPYHALPVPQAS